MSREIKFRGWVDTSQCEKVVNKLKTKGFINSEDHWGSMVKPFCMKMFWQTIENHYSWSGVKIDIQQFTGLKDKNGLTDLYEGDIIDENGLLKGNIYESPQIYKEGIDCLIEGMGTEAWRNTESVAMGRGCRYSK